MKTALNPPRHTQPIGRYSPGVLVPLSDTHALIYVSGQVASDHQGKPLAAEDPARQTEIVFENIEAVLRGAGASLRDLVSLTLYLTDIRWFPEVSAVRDRILSDPAPSSTLVVVSSLAVREHLVEISGVACVRRP